MSSGESIDPRAIEAALDQSPAIVRSCVVKNNFLGASSQSICAIVEPAGDVTKSSTVLLSLKSHVRLRRPIVVSHLLFPSPGPGFYGDQLASLTGISEHESEADVRPTGNLFHD